MRGFVLDVQLKKSNCDVEVLMSSTSETLMDTRNVEFGKSRPSDRDTNHDGAYAERTYVQRDANHNVTAITNDTDGTVLERFLYDPNMGRWMTQDPAGYV